MQACLCALMQQVEASRHRSHNPLLHRIGLLARNLPDILGFVRDSSGIWSTSVLPLAGPMFLAEDIAFQELQVFPGLAPGNFFRGFWRGHSVLQSKILNRKSQVEHSISTLILLSTSILLSTFSRLSTLILLSALIFRD